MGGVVFGRKETPAAAAAFSRYLELGPERSLRALATTWQQPGNGKAPSFRTLARWSSLYFWDRRAHEHDRQVAEEVEARVRQERVEEAVKRRRRRLDLAAVVIDVATATFINPKTGRRRPLCVAGAEGSGESVPSPSEVNAAVRLLKLGWESERLDLGEVTERTEHAGPDGRPMQQQVVVDMNAMGDIADFLERANALADQFEGPHVLPPSEDDGDGQWAKWSAPDWR